MEQRHVWVLGALLLLTTAGGQLHAQSPRIWIGARGGIDIGSLSFDPDTISGLTHGSTTGIAIGAEFDYWFSDHFGV
ncbi:MAG TPA: hypothetical protein VET48_10990, partial [Steroidobacteraceae bacterium]|nr:hypothetical protein [Steroidobacteraceae bacterium]